MKEFNKQPNPKLSGDSRPVWPEVIKALKAVSEDFNLSKLELDDLMSIMDARDNFGRTKYGVPLSTFNKRMPLQDAFEETLDLVVYAFQAYLEGLSTKSKSLWILEELVESSIKTMIISYRAIKQEEKNGKSD